MVLGIGLMSLSHGTRVPSSRFDLTLRCAVRRGYGDVVI
jgi:hypothetical protein